jgi:asparaginyl-tRNA synthetase
MAERVLISQLVKGELGGGFLDKEVEVAGWIRSVRKKKRFSFISISDGSCQPALQIIADAGIPGYEEGSGMLTGSSAKISGKLVASQGKGQGVEMQASSITVLGSASEDYPLQKKATSLEFLRDHAHLRSRTNTFGAVFRIRHALTMATHLFFSERGFVNLHTPIITSNDGEGAGEMFKVTNFDLACVPRTEKGEVDYDQDYFAAMTGLTVTGQLEAECFAMGMGRVYTFGPTFRAENSNTPRHLSEFWMVEPEVAFADLEEVAELAADYVKYMISYTLEHYPQEIAFLSEQHGDGKHQEQLESVVQAPVNKITYTEAIESLAASGEKFEFSIEWGAELQTEHERYLSEKKFMGPVIVTDYPKGCKAFYMKQNDDGKTVRAMDLLVPGVGEIVGGSQREDNLEKLTTRMDEMGMEREPYEWYLDLRRYGSVPHSGFGLGFERVVAYITGMSNVRDVIPFPRTPRSARF